MSALIVDRSEALDFLSPLMRDADASKAVIAAKCYGLLMGYAQRWANADYRVDAVESAITSDLYNPQSQRTSRTFTVAGKIDVHVTDGNGRKVIIDHKTTSQDISDPAAPFWRQLQVEGQVSHYALLEFLNGNKIDYAVWDAVRKPSISPRLLSKKEQDATGSERETPEMYAARLAEDCTTTRPGWYFQRRQVPRTDDELNEYASELWEHAQDMILARRNNRWPRNSGACMLYGSPCNYLGICSGYDTPDSDKWARKSWVHSELPILDGDGKDILTNSRIRAFQTCRRKHYLQYELGIERIDEEEKEALYFGSLFHQALEIYFNALKSQQQRSN